MSEERLLARLHLHTVLPLLQPLTEGDPAARDIASRVRGIVRLSSLGGLSADIRIGDGRVSVSHGKKGSPDVHLFFPAPRFINNLFTKEGVPLLLPLRGL